MSQNKTTADNTKELKYIKMRKRQAFKQRLAFYICRIFPIDKKLISVCTFEGKGGFGCNPKYIVTELHERHPEYKFVWLVNEESWDKQFPDYIQKVKNSFWGRAYWLSRSKVWIDNYRKPYGTTKRKNQYYLNTWHGTVGFKSIGLWRGDAFSTMAYLVSKNDSDMIDDIVTDSKWCDEVFHKGLLFDRPFLKTGYPRCDILFGDRSKQKADFKKKKGIEDDCKLLLFAPTYRETSKDGVRSVDSELWSIDFKRVVEALNTSFGKEWKVVLRLHPQLAAKMGAHDDKKTELDCDYIDASYDDDMYEILAAADALITDYSSVAMEAGFMGLPVFLYMDDLTEYMKARGGEQWIFNEDSSVPVKNNSEMMPGLDLTLPFSIAQNNTELEKNITSFSEEEYSDKIKTFITELELVFDGKASSRVADLVESKIEA